VHTNQQSTNNNQPTKHMTFTVRYGLDTHIKTVSVAPTISQVVDDPNLRAILGYGDNVMVKVNGIEQQPATVVPDGATLVLETRANTKAN
jgi:hypothetical protein